MRDSLQPCLFKAHLCILLRGRRGKVAGVSITSQRLVGLCSANRSLLAFASRSAAFVRLQTQVGRLESWHSRPCAHHQQCCSCAACAHGMLTPSTCPCRSLRCWTTSECWRCQGRPNQSRDPSSQQVKGLSSHKCAMTAGCIGFFSRLFLSPASSLGLLQPHAQAGQGGQADIHHMEAGSVRKHMHASQPTLLPHAPDPQGRSMPAAQCSCMLGSLNDKGHTS